MLVEEREDAIARAKWLAANEERRAKRLEERKQNFLKNMFDWNDTMGQWLKENNDLCLAKFKFFAKRELILANSRREFLQAIQDEQDLWVDTPSECRFLRFRFSDDVQTFPPNKTKYM